jgi:hypothetical protein
MCRATKTTLNTVPAIAVSQTILEDVGAPVWGPVTGGGDVNSTVTSYMVYGFTTGLAVWGRLRSTIACVGDTARWVLNPSYWAAGKGIPLRIVVTSVFSEKVTGKLSPAKQRDFRPKIG